jgi:SPX domain protein involved in polyphosphate accumulation
MTCNEVYLPDVRAWLRLHREGFCHSYPPRRVNNLYFDTLDLDCLNDNQMGTGNRAKLRLRWYGDNLAQANGVFELKGKVAQQGWKRTSAPVTLDLSVGSWAELLPQLRAQTEGLFDVWLGALARPVLINRYWREYYESGDQDMRVTVDWDQMAYEQFSYPRPNLTAPALDKHQIVVEVKADGKLHRRISDLLTTFPLRTGRNSKFASSVSEALPW